MSFLFAFAIFFATPANSLNVEEDLLEMDPEQLRYVLEEEYPELMEPASTGEYT